MTAVVWLLAVVVALLAVFVIGLLRSHADILRALHHAGITLEPGEDEHRHDHDHDTPDRTPTFESSVPPTIRTVDGVPEPAGVTGQRAIDLVGLTPNGGTRTVAVTGTGNATLIAFLTTGCATCADFWHAFAEGVDLPKDTRLVVATKGPEMESPADVEAMAAPHVLTIQSTEMWDAYSVPVAPYFVLVDGRRGVVVGEGAADSWDRVRNLLDRALADAGYGGGQVSRRDALLGRARSDRVDRDLKAAGLLPGDDRLFHAPATDPGDVEEQRSR